MCRFINIIYEYCYLNLIICKIIRPNIIHFFLIRGTSLLTRNRMKPHIILKLILYIFYPFKDFGYGLQQPDLHIL